MTKKQSQENAMCEVCGNCIPIGDGDHYCADGMQEVVLVDYRPTENYLWCKGKRFEEIP